MAEEHPVRWKVSLSNGETFYEGKGDFKSIDRKPSPWNRLMEYLRNNPKVVMTSLSLYTDDGQNYHVPSNGTSPRSPIFANSPAPNKYNFFRSATFDIHGKDGIPRRGANYSVIEASYDKFVVQMWVDEYNPQNCWCLALENTKAEADKEKTALSKNHEFNFPVRVPRPALGGSKDS